MNENCNHITSLQDLKGFDILNMQWYRLKEGLRKDLS